METVRVLMICPPLNPYLVEQLEKRFTLHRFHSTQSPLPQFQQCQSKRRRTAHRPVAEPQILSSFGVGLDKIDLARRKERGIGVTQTPDVLTDANGDLAIGFMLADCVEKALSE